MERLIEHIATYLTAHPCAADTIAGIQKWWLSGVKNSDDTRAIDNAIQAMLCRGLLECRMLPDGTRVYGRPSSEVPRMQSPFEHHG